MRRYEAIIVLVCIISLLLCGCSSWLSGEYLWIQPHEGLESGGGNEMVEVASYIELRDELKALVSDGVQEAVISAANLNETSIEFYVSTAVNYILDNTAIGAYAVDKISYEIGTNRGEPVVAFLVDYKHGANEIRNMKQVSSTAEIFAEIENALTGSRDGLNDALHQIGTAISQVNDGTTQIAEGAQKLSIDTSNQTSSVSEISDVSDSVLNILSLISENFSSSRSSPP